MPLYLLQSSILKRLKNRHKMQNTRKHCSKKIRCSLLVNRLRQLV